MMKKKNAFLAIFISVNLILTSCNSFYSKYEGIPENENNQISKYNHPTLEKKINAWGWTINAGFSIGTAYSAYQFIPIQGTKNFLNGNNINLSDNSIRVIHGLTAGLLVFFANYFIMDYGNTQISLSTNDDAKEWTKYFNSSYIYVDFVPEKFIKIIPVNADSLYVINNLNDAKIFASVFPNSKFSESKINLARQVLSPAELSELVTLFPISKSSSQIKTDLFFNSKNLDEWLLNTDNFKDFIVSYPTSLIQSKLLTLVKDFKDYKKLVESDPQYISKKFLDSLGMSLISSINDINVYKGISRDSTNDSLLEKKGLNLLKSYTDIIDFKKLFPQNRKNKDLDLKAYSMISSINELKQYIENFKSTIDSTNLPKLVVKLVNSPQDLIFVNRIFPYAPVIDEAIDSLLNRMSNLEIVKIIDSIPYTQKLPLLEEKYFSNLRSVDEAISAAEKFPDNIEEISVLAAGLCSNIADYRKYLSYFGETKAADNIKTKYYDLTSKEPENLGKNVNSKIGEYAPVISPDGETLYFCRRNSENPTDDEDIYYTNIESMDIWGEAKNIGPPLNNKRHNAVSGVSQDGSMLLLHNHYTDNDAGLSVSTLSEKGWSIPINIDIPDFYNNSEYHNACLSAEGKTIMISSARKDSYGGNDIYVIHQNIEGKWSEPKNIGPTINTWGEESSIFLAADGVTIYFASDGHGGFGGSDIFMSRRLDNSWTKWSNPENLGDKINTSENERYYVIPASGDFVYFSSYNNTMGQSDIFRIGLPLEMRPNPVVLVSGRVINKETNKPVAAKIYYEDLETGEQLGSVITNPQIGNYKIILPGGKKYGFRAESEGFLPINENVDLTHLKNYKKSMKDLQIVPFERGQSLVINNIFFETGKANLKRESCLELDRLVKYMMDNPTLIIEVSGHTDDVGADDMNMRLSQRRAESVCNYLFKNGIAKERLRSFGYGETMPIVPNNSAANRAKNRRVEIKFVEI